MGSKNPNKPRVLVRYVDKDGNIVDRKVGALDQAQALVKGARWFRVWERVS